MSHPPEGNRQGGLRIGRAFGVPVTINVSTLFMMVVLAFLFATSGAWELSRRTFTVGLIVVLMLFVCVLIHELAHAAVARGFGREVHRVTLTLWGGMTVMSTKGETPRQLGIIAASGPLANAALAGLAWIPLATGHLTPDLLAVLTGELTFYDFVRLAVWINIYLAIFNALPGLPMDGGNVLTAVIWAIRGDRWAGIKAAAWGGRVVAVAVVVWWIVLPLTQGRSIGVVDIAITALVFMILWPTASQALRVATLQSKRRGLTVGSLMVPGVAVRHDATVQDALDRAKQAGAGAIVVTSVDGSAAGHVPIGLAETVPEEERATTTLDAVTMPVPRGTEMTPDVGTDGMTQALHDWWGRTDVWIVRDGDRILGVTRLVDAMKALQ